MKLQSSRDKKKDLTEIEARRYSLIQEMYRNRLRKDKGEALVPNISLIKQA